MNRRPHWLNTFVVGCVMASASACVDSDAERNESANSAARTEISAKAEVPGATLQNIRASAISMLDELLTTIKGELEVPADLTVMQESCGEENAFYDPQTRKITMCDELFANVAELWFDPARSDKDNTQRILGAWRFIFFHELGHGLADVFELPLTGREEDAVDDFSTLLLINAGLAPDAISASGFWLKKAEDPATLELSDFLDEHSLSAQRFGAIVCLVFGSDPKQFDALATQSGLPDRRKQMCPGEFQRKTAAWNELLAPFERDN